MNTTVPTPNLLLPPAASASQSKEAPNVFVGSGDHEAASLNLIVDATQEVEHVGDLLLTVEVVDFLSGYRVPGVLQGFTAGEVTVSLREPLSEQREASVHLHSFAFEGQILYCRPKASGYEAHITIDDAEETGLRRTPRFPVKLPAQLFPPNASPVEIMIVDISSDGLGIELPILLERDKTIALASEAVFVFAVVRHCRKVHDGLFRAGVEMLHLLQRRAEAAAELPAKRFLGTAWGKRSLKKGQ